ncbi:MAG: 4Fe-4S binding protein, partial [Myxococcales bacterium]|nr:4Fe-4S binding protein [Myxococcales bacterium]
KAAAVLPDHPPAPPPVPPALAPPAPALVPTSSPVGLSRASASERVSKAAAVLPDHPPAPASVRPAPAPVPPALARRGLAAAPAGRAAFALPPALVPSVLPHACLATTTFCSVCVERCPRPGAIVVAAGRPRVVPEACDGCGQCVAVCPAPINGFALVPRAATGPAATPARSSPTLPRFTVHTPPRGERP